MEVKTLLQTACLHYTQSDIKIGFLFLLNFNHAVGKTNNSEIWCKNSDFLWMRLEMNKRSTLMLKYRLVKWLKCKKTPKPTQTYLHFSSNKWKKKRKIRKFYCLVQATTLPFPTSIDSVFKVIRLFSKQPTVMCELVLPFLTSFSSFFTGKWV